MIRMLVSRLHVSASNRDAIRSVVNALKPLGGSRVRRFLALPREDRRKLMTTTIREHAENRCLYLQVMAGRVCTCGQHREE